MSYNEWLDIDVLEDYLDGKLDAKAMHEVEKLSLEDPFVAEALAGLSQSPRRTQSLSLLQKQLQERIAIKPIEQKRWRITSHRLSIAATAAVLFVTASLLFWMRENNRQQTIANESKNVKVDIAPEKPAPAATQTPNTVIDQAIADAKTNSYAKNKQRNAPVKSKTASAIVVAAPILTKELGTQTSATLRTKVPDYMRGEATDIGLAKRLGTVSGKVIDEKGTPIVGASVAIVGSNLVANTNANGEFKLSMDSSLLMKQKLAVRSIGFEGKEVEINKNDALNIALTEAKASLQEVVVTGYSAPQKKQSVTASVQTISPLTTEERAQMDRYFMANNKLLKNGALTGKVVELSFTIQKNGRPANIKVVKGLTTAENEEAVRLLNNSPDWKVPQDALAVNSITIKF